MQVLIEINVFFFGKIRYTCYVSVRASYPAQKSRTERMEARP